MTRIGQPTTTEFYQGIPVNLEQLESAFYTLAPAYGEEDYDAIAMLLERARHELTQGTTSMPALASMFTSHALTGSYSAARDQLDHEFRRSGHVIRLFAHNVIGRRFDPVFCRLAIRAREIEPDLYLLTIHESGAQQRRRWEDTLEQMVAEALGIERALTRIQVSFPLEVVKATQYRFDFVPFLGGVRELGIGPMKHAGTNAMTGAAAADYLEAYLNRATDGNYLTPGFYFECPQHRGLALSMTAYGCSFATYDSWDYIRTIYCRRSGSVITGPLQPDYVDKNQLQEPRMVFLIERPQVHEGDPVWPDMVTSELKAPMRSLAAALVDTIER